ncbi:MAG: hypothetical protein WCG78_05135 [Candidatus Omnitrophota bacterium]
MLALLIAQENAALASINLHPRRIAFLERGEGENADGVDGMRSRMNRLQLIHQGSWVEPAVCPRQLPLTERGRDYYVGMTRKIKAGLDTFEPRFQGAWSSLSAVISKISSATMRFLFGHSSSGAQMQIVTAKNTMQALEWARGMLATFRIEAGGYFDKQVHTNESGMREIYRSIAKKKALEAAEALFAQNSDGCDMKKDPMLEPVVFAEEDLLIVSVYTTSGRSAVYRFNAATEEFALRSAQPRSIVKIFRQLNLRQDTEIWLGVLRSLQELTDPALYQIGGYKIGDQAFKAGGAEFTEARNRLQQIRLAITRAIARASESGNVLPDLREALLSSDGQVRAEGVRVLINIGGHIPQDHPDRASLIRELAKVYIANARQGDAYLARSAYRALEEVVRRGRNIATWERATRVEAEVYTVLKENGYAIE